MPLLLDTADTTELERWLAAGVIRGVTTNHMLLRAAGAADEKSAVRIAVAIADLVAPLPVSIPVWRLDNLRERTAELAARRSNIVVKIPLHSADGENFVGDIAALVTAGVRLNVTCLLAGSQAMLASLAGAEYTSLLAGRIRDNGGDPHAEIRELAAALRATAAKSQIVVGSVRAAHEVMGWWAAGADFVTCSPALLGQLVVNPAACETVRAFYAESEET